MAEVASRNWGAVPGGWAEMGYGGSSSGGAAAKPMIRPRTNPKPGEKPEQDVLPPWNVVLLDDQDHSYEYVIRMVMELFGHPMEKAFQIARRVDEDGRAVCMTTHKEHAELKRDQITAFGKDPMIMGCKGSMSAVIEPAEFDGEEDGTGRGDGGGSEA